MYTRVVPRDLFNESKLLKCLGQLVLIIEDYVDCNRVRCPKNLRYEQSEPGEFRIDQDSYNGGLFLVSGLSFFLGAHLLELRSVYNSKEPYPLVFINFDDDEEPVFLPNGGLSPEFIEFADWCQEHTSEP